MPLRVKQKHLLLLTVSYLALAKTAPNMKEEDSPCAQIKGSRPEGGARNPNQSKHKSQGQIVNSWCSVAKEMGQ